MISTFGLTYYTYPSNCFRLSYPVGWNIEEHESSVIFNAPNNSGTIEVIVVNTGLNLDAEAFINLGNATEINWFGTYKNHQESEREISTEAGYAHLTKTLDWSKIPQNDSSIYQQKGEVVYWVNF